MYATRRMALLSGVSALVLTMAEPSLSSAADLPRKAPVAAVAPISPWTFWIEGGPQSVSGGDPSIPALTPAFTPGKKTWGWDVAGAVDYRFNSIWHVSAAFRYGENKKRRTTGTQRAVDSSGYIFAGTTAADRTESNWVADFMVGRDLGFGGGTAQLKAGLRVAEIKGKTAGGGNLISSPTAFTIRQTYNQSNKWTGWGPRVAIEGNAPLSGSWSLDYMAGIAGLFGKHSISQTGASPQFSPAGAPVAVQCFIGCAATFSNGSNNAVFNADAMVGVAYAITPHTKIAVNYHIDYYSDAVRTVSATGAFSNTDRLYHGPSLRFTARY